MNLALCTLIHDKSAVFLCFGFGLTFCFVRHHLFYEDCCMLNFLCLLLELFWRSLCPVTINVPDWLRTLPPSWTGLSRSRPTTRSLQTLTSSRRTRRCAPSTQTKKPLQSPAWRAGVSLSQLTSSRSCRERLFFYFTHDEPYFVLFF